MAVESGFNPFAQFEEVGKQNVAMLERAMKMRAPCKASAGSAKAARSGYAC